MAVLIVTAVKVANLHARVSLEHLNRKVELGNSIAVCVGKVNVQPYMCVS
jgi:hypothetical protein